MSSVPTGLYLRSILKLGKFTIALPVALTGFLGYFLHTPLLDQNALLVIFGVFLLSMGSGAINQIQERKTDALMDRTRNRPIPAGIIQTKHAMTPNQEQEDQPRPISALRSACTLCRVM